MIRPRQVYSKVLFYAGINWFKTFLFNFKKLPFSQAKKLPVLFYGRVKFQNIKGKIIIDAPLKFGMIGFGQRYEKNTVAKGVAEIILAGTIKFKGQAQFGKDYFLCVEKGAYAEFGNMCGIATEGKFICTKSIMIGEYTRIASEVRITDTDFHQMINTETGEKYPLSAPISIGSFNYFSHRTSVLKGTKTSDYCTIASNSLCNKDYRDLGENILLGGVPARLLKQNITRDWETEKDLLVKWMTI